MTTRAGLLSIFLAALLFSTSGVAQAVANAGSTPLSVGASRLFVGSLLTILLLPRLGLSRSIVIKLWKSPAILIAGLCAGTYQVTFFAGVQDAGVALGTLIVMGATPIFAGILSFAFLKQKLAASWAIATTVCLVGLTLLSIEGIDGGSPRGVALSLFAGLAVSGYTVAAKKPLDEGVPPIAVMASTFAFGGLFLIPLYVQEPLQWLLEPRGYLLALYLGIFTMVAANWLHVRGLSVLQPAQVTTLMLLEPLMATLLGIVILDEVLSFAATIGVVLVLAGLLLQGGVLARKRPPVEEVVSPI